ncbi:MAG: Gfo/Idh/MocA family oxidoreductase [Synergistaceae bacterium]|jgi:predicted dehydrogenase|nr:Gfo/Idh/MocA family oxidoreductase [Synergistaceae bacterium]
MEDIKVGVVGVGHLGVHHARVYTEILGARLVGVVDIDDERAQGVAENLGVPAYADLDRFLDETRPDAVSIVVPTVNHFEVAKKVMERGVNLLIEKPVTARTEEAEELLKIASDRNLVLQVGHIERFNSAVQQIREMVHHPIFIQSRRVGPFSPRVTDVGVVLDLMIHDVDIILSLVRSEITDLSAMGRCVRTEHEDMASAQIRFANGTIAHILVSRVTEKRMRTLEITEPERHLLVNYETQDVTLHHCVQQRGRGLVEVVEHPVFPKREPLKLELQDFVRCVREGSEPLVSLSDGKRALEVCVAMLRQIHGEKTEQQERGRTKGLLYGSL